MTSRLDPLSYEEDKRAKETLRVLPVLNFEAVSDSRRDVFRNLVRVGEAYLRNPGAESAKALVGVFREENHGVKSWVARYEGSLEEPWVTIRDSHKPLWKRLLGLSTP